ncbi:MAG: hypothetical protein EA363_03155 [Balneolaceae bacterium]|nr:MAG: hypothetical protein EA363_03155 [Balneolaceae bacterium]
MDMWIFLTVAVIVWGIVEMVQSRSKNKLQKKLEYGEDERKKYGEKIERLERRVANLEAIVVDEESGKAASGTKGIASTGDDAAYEPHQPGTMTNKLK